MQWIKLHRSTDGKEVWINLVHLVCMYDPDDGTGTGAFLNLGGGDIWHVSERVSEILKLIHPEL